MSERSHARIAPGVICGEWDLELWNKFHFMHRYFLIFKKCILRAIFKESKVLSFWLQSVSPQVGSCHHPKPALFALLCCLHTLSPKNCTSQHMTAHYWSTAQLVCSSSSCATLLLFFSHMMALPSNLAQSCLPQTISIIFYSSMLLHPYDTKQRHFFMTRKKENNFTAWY